MLYSNRSLYTAGYNNIFNLVSSDFSSPTVLKLLARTVIEIFLTKTQKQINPLNLKEFSEYGGTHV